MPTESLPIIEGAEGITLLSTWLIAVREDFELADLVTRQRSESDIRGFRLVLTLNHESVHFLQGMTAALPFSYSLNLLEFCSNLMRDSRERTLDAAAFTRKREQFKQLNSLLYIQSRNVSTVDLLEAMAVVEGFRATATNCTPASFVEHLETFYGTSPSPYRRVIDIVRSTFDNETALESTSRLCFLALNGDNPPDSFWTILEILQSHGKPSSLSAIDMMRMAGMDYKTSLLAQHHFLSKEMNTHKILAPYIEYLSRLGSLEDIFEFAARPGDWLRGKGPSGSEDMVPPVIVFSGGRGKKMGLATKWSEEQFFMFVDATALVGACQALLCGGIMYLACPHTDCPVHSTRLCHAWYAIPTDPKICAFPKRFNLHFGCDPSSMLKIAAEAVAYTLVGESSGAFLPVWGRTIEEYRRILNEAAGLSDPKEWDTKMISLLSEAKVDEIEHDLLDNTTYLVTSISGYLFEMVGDLPKNPFHDWMDDHRRIPTAEETLLVRAVAAGLAQQATPWFSLTILRSLKYLLGLDLKERPLPAWLETDICRYAEATKGAVGTEVTKRPFNH